MRAERSLWLIGRVSIRFLAYVLKVRFPLFRIVTQFKKKNPTLQPVENKCSFGGDIKASVGKF